MDIGKSFSFPFEDNQWISKLGLGAVITMVPILNFAWSGFMVELTRNVMNDAREPLPNWDNFGKKLTDGLILFLAGLVYSLPMLIVICLPLSFMIVPALLSGSGDMQEIAEVLAGAGSILFFCLLCVFVLYTLVLSVIYPAILVVFAREGTFASCFKFREVFDLIGKNTANFFTAWGVNLGASFVVGLAVSVLQFLNIIPCIGQIIFFVLAIGIVLYTSVVYTHLFGQFGRFAYGQNQPVTTG